MRRARGRMIVSGLRAAIDTALRASQAGSRVRRELGRSRRDALALIAGVSGWRHGMAVALLSFVGVLGGAIIGVRLAPLLAAGMENPNTRIIVSIAVVVLLVALGETTGVFFGRRIRDRITGERSPAGRLHARLGAAGHHRGGGRLAGRAAAGLGQLPRPRAGVRGSEVLRAVDSVMPAGAKQLPAELRQLLNNSGFPDVLSPFAETPITEVGPPNSALAGSPAVGRRRRQRAQDPRAGAVVLAPAGGHGLRRSAPSW